jgi:hypothetical protein
MADRRELIEEATTAWRPQGGPATGLRPHPAWADLDPPGRIEVYGLTRELRRLEAALDPAGLSTTAKVVLARLGILEIQP